MSKKVQTVHRNNGEVDGYIFYCPGCKENHFYTTPQWSFNGDEEKPTFTPSLLYPTKAIRCHIFVTDGRIQYLSDCGHELAGQTIDMIDWESTPDEIAYRKIKED